MCLYISCQKLKVEDEIEVFNAAKAWIEHDENRREFAAEIMGCISLALIPSGDLIETVRKVPFVRDNEKCMDLVFEALAYQVTLYAQPLYERNINKPRGMPNLVFIQHGHRLRSETGNLLYAVADEKTIIGCVPMDNLSKLPLMYQLKTPFVHASLSAVTHGNFLFMFGVDSRGFTPVTMRFDGSTYQWINLAPIPREATVGSAVVRVGDHIIVAGGMEVDRYTEYDQYGDYTSAVHR